MIEWQDAPADCPICADLEADPVGTMQSGGWLADPEDSLVRQDRSIPLIACRTCGHVRLGVQYDDAFLANLYSSDRVIGSDQPICGGEDTLAFCQEEVFAATGPILDVGCGRGEILRLLRDGHGVPVERLMGLDFQRLLPEGIPFRPVDLNRLPSGPEGELGAGMLFCTHVLEHVREPRGFLRSLRTMLAPGGHAYIEVPDFGAVDARLACVHPLVVPQHLHYFTLDNLTALLRSCGLALVRADARRGVLRTLVRRVDSTDAARSVAFSLDILAARRHAIARTIVAEVEAGGTVGLWGLGMDYARMAGLHPPLADMVSAGRLTLFDLLQAGRRLEGRMILSPDAITGFGGTVWLLPSPDLIARRMLAAARAAGWPPGRIRDPWRGATAVTVPAFVHEFTIPSRPRRN
ncbi:class I SAM-dependent methyltransferase [Niveispirillum sp. KHB5.9]|uniref:class I SAM-dependent methyltransferase n=1 Tax=Niveispirillum sp. KHB5.9 TaxID=3400269 RepID=UPI003A8A312A